MLNVISFKLALPFTRSLKGSVSQMGIVLHMKKVVTQQIIGNPARFTKDFCMLQLFYAIV